jgi:hypothetical protein
MTIAWYDPTNHHVSTDKHDPRFTPLGQLLPLDVPREWVGLTDDVEILAISNTMPYADRFEFARAIEAKLKERNV